MNNRCYSCLKPSARLLQIYRCYRGCLNKSWECGTCSKLTDHSYFRRQDKLAKSKKGEMK